MSWESPLKGYENADSLPTTINTDGKSLYNPPGPKSAAYDEFPKPIDSSNNGFDFHSERLLDSTYLMSWVSTNPWNLDER
jgi:hypothetical protein